MAAAVAGLGLVIFTIFRSGSPPTMATRLAERLQTGDATTVAAWLAGQDQVWTPYGPPRTDFSRLTPLLVRSVPTTPIALPLSPRGTILGQDARACFQWTSARKSAKIPDLILRLQWLPLQGSPVRVELPVTGRTECTYPDGQDDLPPLPRTRAGQTVSIQWSLIQPRTDGPPRESEILSFQLADPTTVRTVTADLAQLDSLLAPFARVAGIKNLRLVMKANLLESHGLYLEALQALDALSGSNTARSNAAMEKRMGLLKRHLAWPDQKN